MFNVNIFNQTCILENIHLDMKYLKRKRERERNRKTYWISNRALKKIDISNKQNIEDNLGEKLINKW